MSENTETAQPAKRSSARTKGIIAIVAGAALLIGGTGTYALWSSQQALSVDDVQAGDLALGLGTGTWELDGLIGPAETIDPADLGAVRIVPGDVLTLDQEIDVTLVGDTIEAILAANTTGVVPAGFAGNVTIVFNPGIGTPDGTNAVRIDPTDAGTVNATLVITFAQSTPNQVGTNAVIDLSAVTFSLTQAGS